MVIHAKAAAAKHGKRGGMSDVIKIGIEGRRPIVEALTLRRSAATLALWSE
jgi:hypothetical protein